MTKISVNVFKDSFSGKVPISYRVTARPVVRQIVDGSIITRNAKTYEGLLSSTFELTPTKLGEAWMISILASNDDEVTGYYKVPDVEEILFTELIEVDPETLEPDAEPEPEWWAVSKATVQGGVVDANGDLILTRSDGMKINAGHVQGEPGVDGVSIPGSPGAPGAPGVGFAGAELTPDGDLNLIKTTGDIINVGHVAGSDGEPNNLEIGTIEFIPGAPGGVTMRVDTTVGTRVFISNGTVEHMVKAETGKRRLTLEAGKGGSVDVSRSNNIVTLTASGITQTVAGLIVTLPLGLRPDSPKYLRTYWNFQATLTIAGSLSMSAVGASDYVSISYETRDAWPIALPGIPQ